MAASRDASQSAPLQDAFQLPALRESVAEARRRVVTRLLAWGASEHLCTEVELVTSELFTNAVLHTTSEKIGCELRLTGATLRIEVADEGWRLAERPARAADFDGENGRGLLLVESFSQTWGVRPGETGQSNITWADFAFP